MKRLGSIAPAVTAGLWMGAAILGGLCAEEPGEKAARYHRLLVKRPESKIIYERFFDAWLDEGSKEGLEEYLGKRAEEGAVADLWILGIYHQQAGEDDKALELFDRAVAKEPKNAGLLLGRAKVNARLLQFEKAIEDLDKIAAENPDEAVEAVKLKGGYLARAGRPDEGVKAWQKLLADNPGDEELAEDLIELEIGEGLYEEALEAAIKLAEGTRDAYQKALRRLRVGEIQKLNGKREEAVATYSTVLRSTGQGTWLEREVLAQIDELFKRDDDFEGLKEFYEKTAEAQPQRTELKKALAHLTAEGGKVEEAVTMMRELMKLSPGDRGLRQELVELLAAYEREGEAATELEKLLEGDKKNAVLWERLAEIRHLAKDKEGTQEALREVDRLAGPGEEARLRVARIYERFDLNEEAEQILRTAAEGESLEAKEALASYLMDHGQEEDALAQWKEMAEGANVDGLMRVVRSLQARGKVKVAYELMVARREDFGRDPVSLAMFCQVAQMADHAGEAMGEARQLVRLADQPTEIRDAVTLAARLIMRAGKEEEVLAEIERAAELVVNDLCLGAELWELLGDSRAADVLLTKAVTVGGGLLALTQEVQLLERRGDYIGASKAMKKIVESEVGRRPIYRKRLVELLRRAGNLDDALGEIERWKQATPGDKLAWLAQADVYSESGKHDEAVTTLRRAQARFGREEDIRVQLANAHLEVGETKAAKAVFEKLYEDAEQNADKMRWATRLAEVAEQDGSVEELVGTFERRKRNNPKSITALLALSEIHRVFDQYDERRAALQEATRRRPSDLDLRFGLARVEERAGDLERAVESLEAARQHDKTGATQRHLARLLLRYGETERALELLKESDDKVTDPREVENLAEVMAGEEEWLTALDYLKPFLARFPTDWRLRYLMAVCAEEADRREEATELFLEVTRAAGPIKGLKPIIKKKDRLAWNKIGEVTLPARAVRLNLVFFYQRSAYSYRNSSPYGSRAAVTNFPLPGDEEEAWALSVSHLMKMAGELRDEEREALLARVEAAGVQDADLLVMAGAQTAGRNDVAKVLSAKLEKEPEDRSLLLLALAIPPTQSKDLDIKWRVAARERFKEDLPLIALIANGDLLASEEEEVRREALEAIPEFVKQLEGDDLLGGLSTVAGLLTSASKERFKLTDEQREDLFTMLMEGFRKSEAPLPRWSYLEGSLLSYAAEQDRYDVVVEILNAACGEPAPAPPGGARPNTRPYYYGSLYAQIQARGYSLMQTMQQRQQIYLPSSSSSSTGPLVPYPPTSLRTVPQGLSTILKLAPQHEEDGRFAAFLDRHASPGSTINRSKLAAAVEKVKDPVLRLLIIAYEGDEEALAKAVAAVEKKEDAGLDELLFAAGYHAKNEGGNRKAFELLAKARREPMQAGRAAGLDHTLLMLGAGLVKKDGLPPELHDVAKRAGLRARRSPGLGGGVAISRSRSAQASRLKQINSALTSLGVEPSKRPKRAVRVASPRRSSSNKAGEEIGKLLQQGNRKAAVRRAARDLGRSLRMVNSRQSSQTAQLIQVVQGLGLVKDILDHLDPGEEAGELRQERFAEVCQLLKENERARPAIDRVLKLNPTNTKAKAMLFALLPPEERIDAIGELELDKKSFEVLQQMFGARTSSSSSDFKQTIDLLKIFAVMLEASKPNGKDDRNLTFINYRAVNLQRTYRFAGDIRVRRLTEARKEDAKDSKETIEYHSAFLDLCVAMLRHPQTAAQGFMLIHTTCEARGDKPDNLENEALLALRAYAQFDPSPQNNRYTSNRWALNTGRGGYTSSSSVASNTPAPVEYLLWLAAEQNRPELLGEDVLKMVEPHDPVLAERMSAYRQILFTKGEERVRGFETLREALGAPSRQPATDVSNGIRILMDHVGDDAEFITRIGESMLESCKTDEHGQIPHYTLLYSVLPVYGSKLMELQGGEAYQKFLLKLSEGLLGKREEWDLVAKANKLGTVHTIRNLARTHSRIMEQLIYRPKIGLPTATYLSRNGLDRLGVNNLQHYLQQAVQQVPFKESADVERLFGQAGFLTDAQKFDPLSFGGDPSSFQKTSVTILGTVCGSVKSSGGSVAKKTGEEWMKAEGKDRLARRLIGAALQGGKDEKVFAVVRGELEANKEILEKMPVAQRVALARFLSVWFGRQLDNNKFPPALDEWRLAVGNGERKQARDEVAEWLKNGFGTYNDYEMRSRMQTAVYTHIATEPELVARLLARYVRDLQGMRQAGTITARTYSQGTILEPWDSEFRDLSYRFRQMEMPPATMTKFLKTLVAQPESKFMSFEYGLLYTCSSVIRKAREKVIALEEVQAAMKKNEKTAQAVIWKHFVEALTKDAPAESEGVLAAGLAYYFVREWSPGTESLPVLHKVADGLEPNHPDLAAALRFGVRYRERAVLADPEKAAEAMRPEHEALAELLKLDGIPNSLKYELLTYLGGRNGGSWKFAGETAAVVAKVLSTHINGERNVLSTSMTTVLARVTGGESEAEKESLRELYKKFSKVVSQGQSGAAAPATSGSIFDRALVTLALAGEMDKEAARLLGGRQSPYKGDTSLLLQLVLEGKDELALQLLPGPAEFYKPSIRPLGKALEKALARFLPQIESETERYRLEVIAGGVKDVVGENAPEEDRSKRLARLVGSYLEKAPRSLSTRLQLLVLFAGNAELPKEMEEEILREGSKVVLAHNLVLRNTSFTGTNAKSRKESALRTQLVRHAVRLELAQGKAENATRQIEGLRNAMGNAEIQREAATSMGSLMGDVVEGITRGLASETKADPATFLPLAKALLEQGLEPAHNSTPVGPGAVSLNVVVHALAGAGAEFDKLVDGLPETKKKRYEAVRKNGGFKAMCAQLAATPAWLAEGNAETRQRVARAILMDEATCNREIVHMRDLTAMVESGSFTRDDILAVITALPEEHPRGTEFMLEKAGIIGWRVQDEKEALKYFELATKQAEKSKNEALLSQCHFYEATYSAEMLKKEERARELVKLVKRDLLVDQDQRRYDDLIKKLKSAEGKEGS